MIQSRTFATEDADAFLLLYRECLDHYGIAPATAAQEKRVLELLRSGRHLSCLMAYAEDRPLGFATWTLTLPAGAGIALYMKEIFVRQTARGNGVGRALLSELVSIAEAEGCVRFDWQTDGDNQTARTFYKSVGAPAKDKISFRVMAKDYDAFRARIEG